MMYVIPSHERLEFLSNERWTIIGYDLARSTMGGKTVWRTSMEVIVDISNHLSAHHKEHVSHTWACEVQV